MDGVTEPALAPTSHTHQDGDSTISIWPGLAVCLGAAAVAYAIQTVIPGLSALLVAILLGVTVSHAVRLPRVLQPGIKVAAKRVLRIGIVLLGLQLALDDILDLGWAMLGVVVVIVAGGLLGTVLIGRLLHLPAPQALLIACGFSICGAAAVAGVEGTIEREDEDVATAIRLTRSDNGSYRLARTTITSAFQRINAPMRSSIARSPGKTPCSSGAMVFT